MEKKARLRAPNFSHVECLHLCRVVENYKQFIENKKTDVASLRDKHEAWLKVVEEYNNTTAEYSRTVESLQQCYKNLKKKAKKRLSAGNSRKQAITKDSSLIDTEQPCTENWQSVSDSDGVSQETCQGLTSSENPQDDPLFNKVYNLVGPNMEVSYTIYDGDNAPEATQSVPNIDTRNGIDTEDTSLKSDEDTSNSRFGLKKMPFIKSKRLRIHAEKIAESETVSERFKSLASEKMDLVSLQKELVRKQLMVEEERLVQTRMRSELLKTEIAQKEESLAHMRRLHAVELDEAVKKSTHSDLMRRNEMERL